MPSEHYTARIIYTMELDGSVTVEYFGDRDRCTELEMQIKARPVESEQIKALKQAAESGGHFPGSDF